MTTLLDTEEQRLRDSLGLIIPYTSDEIGVLEDGDG